MIAFVVGNVTTQLARVLKCKFGDNAMMGMDKTWEKNA